MCESEPSVTNYQEAAGRAIGCLAEAAKPPAKPRPRLTLNLWKSMS